MSEQEKIFLLVAAQGRTQYKRIAKKETNVSTELQLCSMLSWDRRIPASSFFECPFAMACWSTLQILIPNSPLVPQVFQTLQDQLHLSFFMEVIVTMC